VAVYRKVVRPVRFEEDPSENDPIVPLAAGLVRDSHPFSEARFSLRELIPFFGIALDQAMAALMA
jgi:hypothetical protein